MSDELIRVYSALAKIDGEVYYRTWREGEEPGPWQPSPFTEIPILLRDTQTGELERPEWYETSVMRPRFEAPLTFVPVPPPTTVKGLPE